MDSANDARVTVASIPRTARLSGEKYSAQGWGLVVAAASGGGGLLTLAEVCDELQVSRSTFYEWRAKRIGPKVVKLPNGQLRVRRSDLDKWLTRLCEK